MNSIEISINGKTVFEASCENDAIFEKMSEIILYEYSVRNDDVDINIKKKFVLKPNLSTKN